MIDSNAAADYFALKAANDLLREQAKGQLFTWLDEITGEVSRALTAPPGGEPLQVGRQPWQFKSGAATMIGERYGARYQGRTLLVEVGWPREPAHGYVPDGGMARGRVALSQNVMLEPEPLAELILHRRGAQAPQWRVIERQTLGEAVNESLLRAYVHLLLAE